MTHAKTAAAIATAAGIPADRILYDSASLSPMSRGQWRLELAITLDEETASTMFRELAS